MLPSCDSRHAFRIDETFKLHRNPLEVFFATTRLQQICANPILHSPEFQEGTSVVGVWALYVAAHWVQLRMVWGIVTVLSILIAVWGAL